MRSILRITCSVLTAVITLSASAQTFWSESNDKHQNYFASRSSAVKPSNYKLLNLNAARLHQVQAIAPFQQNDGVVKGAAFDIPMPDGSIHSTTIVETSVWANRATNDAIGIKTYSLYNPKTKAFEGNIAVSNDGISGVLFSDNGLVYINPLNIDNSGAHIVSYLKDGGLADIKCLSTESVPEATNGNRYARTKAGDCKARIYRLAVAATGEYTTWAGGVTQAKNYITITVNILNAIYKRDVNVTFSLVDNTSIIHTDASTDPYSASLSTAIDENQSSINTLIGVGNYDVGIVFNRGWSGGLAQLNAVCGGGKARGGVGFASGTGANPTPGPQGQWFDGAAAHELGHMFGAGHTFAGTNGACGSNRSIGSSWEPGSGSTLMAYAAAGCGGTNAIQTYQDYYFHGGSIGQMQNYITTGATCVTGTSTANVAPSATTAGTSYNIPANTPFVLTVNSTDANGDALTYAWDEMDATSAAVDQSQSPQSSSTSGPLFRSYPPGTSPTRYFPQLANYAASPPVNYAYEVLPSVARTMNFRGTVRDNSTLGGCTSEVNVTLNVQASTGFLVTLPAWGTTWSKSGNNTAPVQWDMAGTNLSPINCTQVDILLSTDGGLTYPITLASAVPNTGSYNVPIPAVNTNNARVMVKGTNNVFFNISTDNFTISDPMPVSFLYFKARKEGNTAVLDWSTATETNSDKFIVERSANGNDFTQIGTVKAAGNSTTVINYGSVDAFPLNKWNYYRIKEVDLDGKFLYSTTASVYFNKDKGSIISVYPNPVKNTTAIDFYTERGAKVKMDVYDSKGALVSSSTYMATTGFNRTSINIQSLSTGIYTLKCYTEGEVIGIMKLIKN